MFKQLDAKAFSKMGQVFVGIELSVAILSAVLSFGFKNTTYATLLLIIVFVLFGIACCFFFIAWKLINKEIQENIRELEESLEENRILTEYKFEDLRELR